MKLGIDKLLERTALVYFYMLQFEARAYSLCQVAVYTLRK